ncbi:rubredoxin [Panacibacter ginsenosidivorans]|uniref:Rubredoxin n=1 Tax=Panacibacter ginsenosidivorans TaxID=1813871 RepID=A0A5B8VFI5_9BACT|nr:rubredoxin [Panacibacter ginsenosidivorans]QEC69873.1 rubredoxin [Panacibacter ginsenosidivorans]
MRNINTIKVNFKGGIIAPGQLYNILLAAAKSGLLYVRFGLRQQLLFDVEIEELDNLTAELQALGFTYELNQESFPNIMSSCPAEEVFILNTWLKEHVYKEVLDAFTYTPRLKINISDSNQSFTPLLTGNINWVASPTEPQFWHLFIRFPKTNIVYEWKDIVHTKDIAGMSLLIEETILQDTQKFYDNKEASGDELYEKIKPGSFHTRPAAAPLSLPAFNLPYYEGLNRYSDKYWLGIYRRDELYDIKFMKDICLLCLQTGIEQLYSTPWKTIIIKGINGASRKDWNDILDKHQINVRHAANELNFQVEDYNIEALKLKHHLVKYLNDDDSRTFGVCIGIKTRRKSEVFCSILVKRKPLIRIGKWEFLHVYDILCAKDYNPNERTDFVYSKDNPKFVLAEQLRRAVISYYRYPGETEAVYNDSLE